MTANPTAFGPLDPDEMRACMGHFPTGVAVVTYANDAGRARGVTVNSFVSVSLSPPLVLVSVKRTARAAQWLRDRPFAINVLTAEQEALALHFAGRSQALTADLWEPEHDPPRLRGCAAHLVCSPWAVYDGGDHLLFVGRVVAVQSRSREPLVFHLGRFREVGTATGARVVVAGYAASSGWAGDIPAFAGTAGLPADNPPREVSER